MTVMSLARGEAARPLAISAAVAQRTAGRLVDTGYHPLAEHRRQEQHDRNDDGHEEQGKLDQHVPVNSGTGTSFPHLSTSCLQDGTAAKTVLASTSRLPFVIAYQNGGEAKRAYDKDEDFQANNELVRGRVERQYHRRCALPSALITDCSLDLFALGRASASDCSGGKDKDADGKRREHRGDAPGGTAGLDQGGHLKDRVVRSLDNARSGKGPLTVRPPFLQIVGGTDEATVPKKRNDRDQRHQERQGHLYEVPDGRRLIDLRHHTLPSRQTTGRLFLSSNRSGGAA